MTQPIRTFLIAGFLNAALILSVGSVAFADSALDSLERGRELTQLFLDGDLVPVHDAFSAEMVEAIGDVAELQSFRDQVLTQLGEETLVLDESITEDPTARFSLFQGPVIIQWALDDDGTVIGFYVAPGEPTEAAPSEYLDYETQASLRLPFTGEWTVGWGGRTVEENYHAAYVDQRFAYDFVIVRNGSSHEGTGLENADYYCFGEPILAPAAGSVVAAVDSVPDNAPGKFDDGAPLGNHVIIDHGEGEYSFLAHLQKGSVAVAPGQQVAAGEQVGACGNSGRSSEPHLHYHLQNSAQFGRGEGMPAQFLDYFADSELVASGEPVRGQQISETAGF